MTKSSSEKDNLNRGKNLESRQSPKNISDDSPADDETELIRLNRILSETRNRLSKNRDILRWIINSRSWKMTAPLRRLNLFNQKKRLRLKGKNQDCFDGNLEKPVEAEEVSGSLEISGWVYSTAAPIERIEVFLDYISLGVLRYGNPRPELTEYPSAIPLNCGFLGRLFVEDAFSGRYPLLVRVTDKRGNIKDFTREISIADSGEESAEKFIGSETGGFLSPDELSAAKKSLTAISQAELKTFLNTRQQIEFPIVADTPQISIILVLYNRAELTLQCLYSILKSNSESCEIIIVDNASTDETRRMLKQVPGAKVVLNETNLHFLRACNLAAEQARGKYILFLNNDAQLQGGSIDAALKTIESAEDIGAVGGKIILPDGTLQEAGSIIRRDGTCQGYGRGESPFAPEFMFRRDVDYCSGAFLLTGRELFLSGGGFDEAFAPAYYEETDYCVRLWKQGKRVVFEPNATIVHYEFASSISKKKAFGLQAEHQKIFARKHREWLQKQPELSTQNLLSARSRPKPGAKRILLIEDRVPHQTLGTGYPRTNYIIRELVRLGHAVTCYPLLSPHEDFLGIYQDIPNEVEVVTDYGAAKLESFFGERKNYYDVIIISRPHNMKIVGGLLRQMPEIASGAKIVYDAEAIFTLREVEESRLKGKNLSGQEIQDKINEEIKLAEQSDCVVSVSGREAEEFKRRGFANVHVLGHALPPTPTPNDFAARKDFLFVGALNSLESPNTDSLLWFVQKIFPKIRQRLGAVDLIVVGDVHPDVENLLKSVQIKGRVDDLTEFYNNARIFIAPTRFAAGIPHKVHQAAAYGLPTVTTPLIAEQLGWQSEEVLIAGDEDGFADACVMLYETSELWNRLRKNALDKILDECSPEKFAEQLKAVIEN